ncbi:AMP-binding protein [Pantoea eucalypti]|uniref:AMP-binding protein n=1 Tax=Pantoea eucalypti TaxID=470933 RepID=UPI003EE73D9A
MSKPNDSLFTLFNNVTQKKPEALAISGDNGDISYRNLFTHAQDIARLIGFRDKPVAIICRNHANAIAAMLACLRNQVIFIPVSTDLPEARIQAILLTASVELILTDSYTDSTRVNLHIDNISQANLFPPPVTSEEANAGIAYILFTSGTTGTPKGVAQSETALRQHMLHYIESLNIKADDRIIMVASFGYDAALMDIFAALLTGATLVPVTLLQHTVKSFRQKLLQRCITVFHSTPSVFRLIFNDAHEGASFDDIRAVVLGGELARRSDLLLFNRSFSPAAILINGFGPSESTLALQAKFHQGERLDIPGLPIGYPVAEMAVQLINQTATADGVVGEIVLESPNVFMGYVTQPQDIARLQAAPRKTSHATGDLARPLPDGRLIYIGRKDNQVKIAGIRIELEEINALLVEQPGIEDAATRLIANEQGYSWLVSWVLTTKKESVDEESVLAALRLRLPQTAVPARIIPVARFQYRPNGKVDLSSLPVPSFRTEHAVINDTFSRQVATVWQACLGADSLPALSERFMDIGGSSLSAISIISRIQQEMKIRLRPSSLLRNPTLNEFIEQVKTGVENAV